LTELAKHEDPYVQIWAARECLEFNADFASRVLEDIGSGKGLLAFSAETTLKEWRKRKLLSNQLPE